MSPQTVDPAAPERSRWRRWPFRLALLMILLAVGLALGACGGGGETGNGGGGATSAGAGATSAGGGATGAYGGATASGGTVGLNQLPSATEELGTSQGNP